MELGATVCRPVNPQCGACPLNEACKAFKEVCFCVIHLTVARYTTTALLARMYPLRTDSSGEEHETHSISHRVPYAESEKGVEGGERSCGDYRVAGKWRRAQVAIHQATRERCVRRKE